MTWRDDELCLGLEEPCTAKIGERCEACQLYAHLGLPESPSETGTETGTASYQSSSDQPLPSGLGARLRAMSEDFAEADPLYIRALAGEPLGEEIPPEEADNPGRRAAHDALAVTFAEARRRREMPPALESKLRAVPRRSAAARLPIWLADSRWATAASLMLTAVLALAAGDVSARFQAMSDPAPIVSRLEAGRSVLGNSLKKSDWRSADLAEHRAELEALIGATDEQLAQVGETASVEARGRLERFAAWSRTQALDAREAWQITIDAAGEQIDSTVRTLEETKIGQIVVDLLLEGENDV